MEPNWTDVETRDLIFFLFKLLGALLVVSMVLAVLAGIGYVVIAILTSV